MVMVYINTEASFDNSVLEICNIFIREQPCRSVILIKLHCNFIEITFCVGVLLLIRHATLSVIAGISAGETQGVENFCLNVLSFLKK